MNAAIKLFGHIITIQKEVVLIVPSAEQDSQEESDAVANSDESIWLREQAALKMAFPPAELYYTEY